jgi:hypothetical protein
VILAQGGNAYLAFPVPVHQTELVSNKRRGVRGDNVTFDLDAPLVQSFRSLDVAFFELCGTLFETLQSFGLRWI